MTPTINHLYSKCNVILLDKFINFISMVRIISQARFLFVLLLSFIFIKEVDSMLSNAFRIYSRKEDLIHLIYLTLRILHY